MKRHPKSPRRGDARSRAMSDSATPAEDASGQATTPHTAHPRRSVLWPVSLLAGLVVLIVLACSTWMLAQDALQTRRSLQQTNANALLATQQLDAVFEVLWHRFPKDQRLSATDRALLQTWMRFDEKYVFDNFDNPLVRFQCATVHRRIGQGTFILGKIPDALEHFRHAIELFESLSTDHPTITSYRSELADAYVRIAWVLHAQGDAVGVDNASSQASRIVADAPLPNDAAFNEQCAGIFSSLADLALLHSEHARAAKLLEQSALLYRILLKESPETEEYRALLTQVEAKLALNNTAQP